MHKAKLASLLPLAILLFAGLPSAQTDPGVQGGFRGTGASIINPANDPNGLTNFFQDGFTRFGHVRRVSTFFVGIGPRFNSDNCSSCHGQPTFGGTGPSINKQFTFNKPGNITAPGNTMPYFITANGPSFVARFPFFFNPDGTVNTNAPNGGVETIFPVTGRTDAGTCNNPSLLPQPDFNHAQAANNIIFRIATPLYGAGLVENLDDSTLLQNQAANLNNNFGIAGTFNRNGNDGTISRFGWKAQVKSLQIFSGEAFNVEMGITNQLFPQERPLPEEDQFGLGLPAGCLNLALVGYPEDRINPLATPNTAVLDDVSALANFARFLAPPPPGRVLLNGQPVPVLTINTGAKLFKSVGCAACHNPIPGITQPSSFDSSLSNVPVRAYSDLELHHMGTGLADNVSQGTAGGDEFRTAPLWGLGQREFLLHDGRTNDLIMAIQAHASDGSEATTVVQHFFALSPAQQQLVLDFLRSL